MRNAAARPLSGRVVGRVGDAVPAADAGGVTEVPGLCVPGLRAGACRFTNAVLRYTARKVTQEICQRT